MNTGKTCLNGVLLCIGGLTLNAEDMKIRVDPLFQDVTESANLAFVHQNGMAGELWLAEILGSGVGVLDIDDDGLFDIWAVQGGPLAKRQGVLPSDQLFKNESRSGVLRFRRITEEAGVTANHYGMGIATGDVDRDGDTDVFLANFGANELWRNQGDGTFESVAAMRKFDRDEWSIAASFFDANDDGKLDLYLVNYVDFSLGSHKQCLGIATKPDYCAPTAYPSFADRLYQNVGSGTFDDITQTSGIYDIAHGGLGVIAAHFDNDRLMDLYVANDPAKNFLWRNRGAGSFENVAMNTGVAVNGDGKSEASMGIDASDYDNDCDIDLFMTNLTSETNTLFENSGKGWYLDVTNNAGLGGSSYPFTGFGTGWVDFDLDGDLDVFVANGAVSLIANEARATPASPLAQRNQLWENVDGIYVEIRGEPLVEFADVSRGTAFADLDNDGDQDIIVSNNNGSLRVYQNEASAEFNWIGFVVEDHGAWAYHAEVSIVNHPCNTRTVRSDGGYASANDPRVVFGLGNQSTKQQVSVTWPDGSSQQFGPLEINRYHVLERR